MSQEFIDAQVGVFAAAAKGQTDELRSLVEKDPALINAYSPEGFTPLGLAAFFGHAEAVEALLAAGADVNYRATILLSASQMYHRIAARNERFNGFLICNIRAHFFHPV